MIEVEQNIPIPEYRKGRSVLYPVHLLEPGDSFLVTGVTAEQLGTRRSSLYNIFYRLRQDHPDRRFTTRTVPAGIRVWRTI